MLSLPKIIARIDFSERSPGAARYAGRLACHFHAELTQPSQFSAIEAGKIFIFSKCTPKVSTTFGVGERELTRQQR